MKRDDQNGIARLLQRYMAAFGLPRGESSFLERLYGPFTRDTGQPSHS